ncbi:hypothetical protein HDV00_008725 [Rhizophlyctis rosea]|nr:hypothetical protein HDV00_008725 [Rhizophlyctis rosea]
MAAVHSQPTNMFDYEKPQLLSTSQPLRLDVTDIRSGMFKNRILSITAPNTNIPPIIAAFHSGFSSKPDIEFHRGDPDGPNLATVKFHAVSCGIDIDFIGGQSIKLKSESWWKHKVPLNLGGHEAWWKNYSEGFLKEGGFKLVDANDDVLAYCKRKSMEIFVSGLGQEAVQMIVVTGVTMIEKARRDQQAGEFFRYLCVVWCIWFECSFLYSKQRGGKLGGF